jgi:hypothetical protein
MCPKENISPSGENSPNLVTLLSSHFSHFFQGSLFLSEKFVSGQDLKFEPGQLSRHFFHTRK